ncbi:MAG: M81 family metallopeptidase [Clostridia bacterium]|nr:M81 family metallopeptidase [Clostridia bacterium]
MKVMIGAFAHESNDFCPNLTTRDRFEFYEGAAVLEHLPVVDIFRDADIEMIPSIYARAESYGVVEEKTYLFFEEKILNVLRAHPDVDGIWMFCHGAMNVENIGSGEYKLACDMRKIVGDDCVISFGMDLHGNIEPDMATKVNIMRCYHTAPHTDQPDTYRRTAKALVSYLKNGYRMFPQLRKLRMIFPGEMAATTTEPFKSIIALMKDWEANDPAIECASTYIGFAWTDAPRTASTVMIVPSAPEYEQYCSDKADELAELVFGKRREFAFETLSLPPAETARTSLYELEAPVCVTDMGDNPTAGTTGGSLVLLNEYLKINDPAKRVLVVGIYDPKAFETCVEHVAGDAFRLKLGVDIDDITRPIDLDVIYRGRHDMLAYDIETNPPIKRCEAATVSTGAIDIVITDKPMAFTQRVQFESCGLDGSSYDVVVTKFGYIFPELKTFTKSYIMSNTPGESYQMVAEFNYKHINRPIFPVDDI